MDDWLRRRLAAARGGWAPAALIAAGVAIRLVWSTTVNFVHILRGEANNVALSIARHGTFADAFRPGQGPTAHLSPVVPFVAGMIYRVALPGTPLGDALIVFWSLTPVVISWIALYRIFGLLGLTRSGRLGALAVLTLIPVNAQFETVQFGVWEGGLGVALAYLSLWQVLILNTTIRITLGRFAALALLAAITLLVSPPLGIAVFICGVILTVTRTSPRRWPAIGALATLVTVVVIAPWTIRNIVVMHAPIILRDNFGLEFSQAYYAGVEVPGDPFIKFKTRHFTIHPYWPLGYAALKTAGGEVAYASALGRTATAWVVTHPVTAIDVAAGHLRDFLFPPRWYWAWLVKQPGKATQAKLIFAWLVSVLGLIGLFAGWLRCGRRYAYVVAMTLLPIAPYLLVEPTLRYRYLIGNLLVFNAAWLIQAAVADFRLRSIMVAARRHRLAAPPNSG